MADLVLQAQLTTLEGLLSKFTQERDREFASSLIEQGKRRGLSPKQTPWVQKLIEKANGVVRTPEREKVEIGDCSRIIELFDKAKQKLKAPAIVLGGQYEGVLRLKPAGPQARVPGSINVVSEQSGREPVWLGRVLRDGHLEISPKVLGERIVLDAIPFLRAFAVQPEVGAKQSARFTGRCCFCNTRIKDARSTEVGYGPDCAESYGLPWG